MNVELLEVRDFLSSHMPFAQLSEDDLDAMPRWLELRYFRRDSVIIEVGFDNRHLYIIRSGAVELTNPQENLMARLGEGECFGNLSLVAGIQSPKRAKAIEDCLVYMLPGERFQQLRRDYSHFDHHFNQLDNDRMQRAVRRLHTPEKAHSDMLFMTSKVHDLLQRRPICATPEQSIREVATIMSRERVSSLLVTEQDKLVGIVTDRDLRSRVLAIGRSPEEPVRNIMTADPISLPASAFTFEALLTMTHHNLHHMPIVENGELLGLVTTTDLMRQQSANPVYLVGDIRKQPDVESMARISRRLPHVLADLVRADASAYDIGRIITSMGDAVTKRLVELAEEKLGAAPLPYAWLVFGSQARGEQGAHSDQDNALLLDDSYDPDNAEHQRYFTALADFICDGLNICGYRYCPGEIMARNSRWRQPLRQWQAYFDDWIDRPEPEALLNATIFFDMRAVCGDVTLFERLQTRVLKKSAAQQIFIAHLAKNALNFQPPLGFFRQFVLEASGEHQKTFNLKERGVVPIIDAARVYALSNGIAAVNTHDRLLQLETAGKLSRESALNLRDAWEFIAFVRFRHQAQQIGLELAPDNYVAPDSLSDFERHHLKDAFKIVSSIQNILAQHYQVGRLA